MPPARRVPVPDAAAPRIGAAVHRPQRHVGRMCRAKRGQRCHRRLFLVRRGGGDDGDGRVTRLGPLAADAPPRRPSPHRRHPRPSPPPPSPRLVHPWSPACATALFVTVAYHVCSVGLHAVVAYGVLSAWDFVQLPRDCLLSPCGFSMLFVHRPLISTDVAHAPVRT